MRILIDTNVALRLYDNKHSHQAIALEALGHLKKGGHEFVIVTQVLNEFWATCTRPVSEVSNGLGLSVGRTSLIIDGLLQSFTLLREKHAIFPVWLGLVKGHGVIGRHAYDARLVAAMIVHGISHLLTFNVADFANFTSASLLDPLTVSASSVP